LRLIHNVGKRFTFTTSLAWFWSASVDSTVSFRFLLRIRINIESGTLSSAPALCKRLLTSFAGATQTGSDGCHGQPAGLYL